MKKIITSIALSFFVSLSFAQYVPIEGGVKGTPVNDNMDFFQPKVSKLANKTGSNDTFTVAHFAGALDTSRFIWDINLNYTDEDELRWVLTSFDTLHDSQGNTKAYSTTLSTLVDSIFIRCGHKKTSPSTVTDSILIKLLNLTIGGITWDTVITTTTNLGATNDWFSTFLLRVPCKHLLAPNNKFAIRVDFAGPVNQDTFGIIVGFKDGGACGANPISAYLSEIPYRTYRNYAKLDTSFTPTPSYAYNFTYPSSIWNGVFFYDCNGDGYTPDSNEEDFFQSAYIFADVIIGDFSVGIAEGSLTSALNVYPNPSTGVFNVNMDLGSAVDMNITVTDLQGKVVYSDNINNATQVATQMNLSHLNKGVYIFRAATATGSAIQKIVIN